MPRSVPPAALLVGAVLADGGGAHSLALTLVLLAIPAVSIAALSFFGELADGSADRDAGALYVGLTSIALVLLVIGAAVRSSGVPHSGVPALGVSTVVGALALLGLQLTVRTWLHVSRNGVVPLRRAPTS
jgi:hypothetical protein